jgi:tetratricopeptide (TPR) repeat protein
MFLAFAEGGDRATLDSAPPPQYREPVRDARVPPGGGGWPVEKLPFRSHRVARALALLAIVLLVGAPRSFAVQQELMQQLQRGIDELQRGNPQAGLAEIEKAIVMEPRLAAAHYYAGMASAQMRQWQQAYDYFVTATLQAPGYGDAHMQACRVAYSLGNLDDAFFHAVLASRAGIDMTAAFDGLEAAMDLPPDWRRQIEVPRVMIGAIDIQALLQQDSSVFGGRQAERLPPGADQSGTADVNPLGEFLPGPSSGAFPLGLGVTGTELAAALQAEIHEVRRQFGEGLARSQAFGVVSDVELASYVLFIKVDDVGEGPPVPLKGFVKLLHADSGEEAYSRPLELSNIGSVADLRSDVGRYLGYLEEWQRQRAR